MSHSFHTDDGELYPEAQDYKHVHEGPKFEKEEEKLLQEQLAWVPHRQALPLAVKQRLARPVAIPQALPGLQSLFSRAWAPILAGHDIRKEEFLQFIDHLNVCKAASPPLEMLNLAGAVLGFAPIPGAMFIGVATQAVAMGGSVAVSRVRISKYLEQVNKEYFAPRGLHARIAKQDVLSQIIGQPPKAPLLAPSNAVGNNASLYKSFRDRRLQILGSYIARLQFVDLPAPQQQHNTLDRLSAKMSAHKAERKEHKFDKDRIKGQEEEGKEHAKPNEETAKLEHERMKVNHEANRELADKPHDAAKINRKREEELAKIDRDLQKAHGEYREKSGAGIKDENKAARKILWIVVDSVAAGEF